MKAIRNIQNRSGLGQKRKGDFFPSQKGKGLFFKKEKQNNEPSVSSAPIVQKQTTDTAAPEVTQDPAVKPKSSPFPEFDFEEISQSGNRFDATYAPVGSFPQTGILDITLWVNITFEDFSAKQRKKEPYKSHEFTPEQLADFAWTASEREAFETNFMSSVEEGWSDKHILSLNDPFFAPYRTAVKVTVMTIDDPALAHVKMKALKVPKGAPRFRSFVVGDEATLEQRDPTEIEEHNAHNLNLLRQIGPFGFDSAEITPDLKQQIDEAVDFLKNEDPNQTTWRVGMVGRASKDGNATYNKKLGERRSEVVKKQMIQDMGWSEGIKNFTVLQQGEENATTEAKFRRVDLVITKFSELNKENKVTQNTAAHEAGHMFGLGDEYMEEKVEGNGIPKFLGDKPSHYNLVKDLIHEDAANELLIHDSDSIMSKGQKVKKGHYVFFLEALNQMTNKKWGI